MNTYIKNMVSVVVVVGIIGLLGIAGYAAKQYARSVSATSTRSFVVSGEGRVTAAPDIALFTYGVVTTGGKDLATLRDAHAKKSQAISDFLAQRSVSKLDIRTVDYSINPDYQYFPCTGDSQRACPSPVIAGYTVRQTTEVKIRDFAQAGDLLKGVVDAGANVVSQLSFQIDEPTQYQDKARGEAIAHAVERARMIAKTAGIEIGRILSIDDGYTPASAPYYAFGAEAMDARVSSVSPVPSIEPGSEDIRVSVNVRFEIK